MQKKHIMIVVPAYVKVKNEKVKVSDIVKLAGADEEIVKILSKKVFYDFKNEEKIQIFSSLKLMEFIESCHPETEVSNDGETDFILEYEPVRKESLIDKSWVYIKTIFVILAIFAGAAFTIMTFNSDVDVEKVFGAVYKLAGVKKNSTKILEISYSIGIFFGITIFFNHLSRKKAQNDPTPLEVQMQDYQNGINKAIIEQAKRDNRIHDV